MKLTSILVTSFLIFSSVPMVRAAEPSDVYADAVYASSVNTYAAANAIGEPDGAYADFMEELADVTLDMGEGEEGTGDLTFTSQALEYGASWQVEFYDENLVELDRTNGSFGLYETETTATYSGTEPYRYVKVICVTDKRWRLDAVEAASIVEAPTEEEPAEEPVTEAPAEEEPAAENPDAPPQGLLVKLVDDGDPSTTADAAVYVIGADGMRHAFPSVSVYTTWFEDFEDVAFIDPANLASYQLGANVTVRPGTRLVKITTDPKVYAVEPGGVLRWVTSEAIALALYGEDWNLRVMDVPDTFWGNYTVGDAITTETHPEGSLGVLSTGEVTYLGSDAYYSLPGDVFDFMRFNMNFRVNVSDEKLESFEDGGELSADPDIAYPY